MKKQNVTAIGGVGLLSRIWVDVDPSHPAIESDDGVVGRHRLMFDDHIASLPDLQHVVWRDVSSITFVSADYEQEAAAFGPRVVTLQVMVQLMLCFLNNGGMSDWQEPGELRFSSPSKGVVFIEHVPSPSTAA
jgi:hypothetical protein